MSNASILWQNKTKTDISNFENKIKLKSFIELKNQINLTKTMARLQVFLISNLQQPGYPQKTTTPFTRSQKQLILM